MIGWKKKDNIMQRATTWNFLNSFFSIFFFFFSYSPYNPALGHFAHIVGGEKDGIIDSDQLKAD